MVKVEVSLRGGVFLPANVVGANQSITGFFVVPAGVAL